MVPTPRNLNNYPAEYAELFRRAWKGRVEIELASAGRARSLRDRLYAFRAALVNELNAAAVMRDDRLHDILLTAPLARMRVRGKKLCIFYPKGALNAPKRPAL